MARDSTLPVRKAVLTALKADDRVTDIVASGSVYAQSPPGQPSWPFIRYGGPSTLPITGSCLDGQELTLAMHGFAKARFDGAGRMIETAEDHAARIGAAIASTLDRRTLVLSTGFKAKVRWRGSTLLQDGAEADAYHTVQNFRVRVYS